MALKELRLTLSQRMKILKRLRDKIKASLVLQLTEEEALLLVDLIQGSLVIKKTPISKGQGFLGKNTRERYLVLKP